MAKNPKFEETVVRNQKGEFSNKDKTVTPTVQDGGTLPYEDDDKTEEERLTSLLADYLPLKEERNGKVPELKADDDTVKAQAKLARYLRNNFDGDMDEANLNALERCYGMEAMPLDDDCDYGIADDDPLSARKRLACREAVERETQMLRDGIEGADIHTYWQDGHVVFVVDGKPSSKTKKPDATFCKTGLPVRVIEFGQLQAAATVMDNMSMGDDLRERVAYALMCADRRDIRCAQLDGCEAYSVSQMMVRNSARFMKRAGLGVADIPEPGEQATREEMYGYARALDERYRNQAEITLPNIETYAPRQFARDYRMNQLAEPYRQSISGILRAESNSELNKAYAKRSQSAHSATVSEWKKNRNPEHDKAGRESSFAKDFQLVEVDDSVDLQKFQQLSKEYAEYKNVLPKERVKADLRWRYTGRHHANGTYHPDVYNIAVDPRSPGSFTHEYFHHLDFTHSETGRQISMDKDFQRIVEHYQRTVDRTQMSGSDPERHLAPTEIFARAGELWVSEHASGSSFLHTKEEYATRFDFQPLNAMHDEVMRFMDKYFG